MIPWRPFQKKNPTNVQQGVACLWALQAPNLKCAKYVYVVGHWRQGEIMEVIVKETGSMIAIPRIAFWAIITPPTVAPSLDDSIDVTASAASKTLGSIADATPAASLELAAAPDRPDAASAPAATPAAPEEP